MADFQRETALRLFAQEFRDSTAQIQGEGERDPNYVVSPLGAKVNRLHVVGVCTEVEAVGEQGDVWRARISDPTGIFTVYAGQYQPEAMEALSNLQPPTFVAVTGKARTYEPEPGSVFVSIRPEAVHEVDQVTRDQWLVDTARRTKERIDGVASGEGAEADLVKLHYGDGDPTRFRATLRTALEGLLPGGKVRVHEGSPEPVATGEEAPSWTPPPKAEEKTSAEEDERDDFILALVGRLEGDDGARWDDILGDAEGDGHTSEDVEESLNRLMDKGLVYEPTLGVLKTT